MASDLEAVAGDHLDADPAVTWTVRDRVLQVTLSTDTSRWFTLDLGTDAFPLGLGSRYSIPEPEYDLDEQPDAVTKQLDRGLAYLHGQCEEVTKRRGRTEISWSLTLPDGTVAKAWRTPLQRLRHRLTGKSRLVRTCHIPG
ncbi:hypothetical protein G7075_15305 [Phycicoccus sp. HDW14]|uniref:hypothetical protein n=1 Tax=Phycicoccus sp. HDW14 TaxID=2714941 RepID=UPI00140B1EED|nr:hypothetical protein [Phycicoccus sp. HDW14]QIM22185.1 hypothetical protein G7075_15305 [Phycicoccus sp. HDW14]